MQPGLRLRPVTEQDTAFLAGLYASTRQAELARFQWLPAQIEAFLQQQFRAQDRSFRQQYPAASRDLIVQDDEPIGRLYVLRTEEEIRLIDIAILPGRQGKGVGRSLLLDLMMEAQGAGTRVTLHVERENVRAREFYTRLGFHRTETHGVHDLLEWPSETRERPGATAAGDRTEPRI